MAKSSLPQLPWEILAYIFTFVPPSHLPSLILACQALRRLAEPSLYRHISLPNCPTRCFYLLRTLLARDELCKHIQTFHPADRYTIPKQHFSFPLSRRMFGDRLGREHQEAYYRHIERVVERLCHVENISIPGLVVSTEKMINVLARFPQIKGFRCFGDMGELGSLLNRLPCVTHLEIPFYPPSLSQEQVQPHHARNLEGLFCPPYVAISLVPSRPIKQLSLFWCSSPSMHHGLNTWEFMEAMGQSTQVIRSLGLFFGSHVNVPEEIEQIFSATARFLPDVEGLTIWASFWKHNLGGLARTLSELCENLSSFSKLRSLNFNGSIGVPDGVPYFDHRRKAICAVYTQILQIWSECCPTLERVTFPNGAVWVKERISPHRRQQPSFLRKIFSLHRSPIDPTPQDTKGSPEWGNLFEENSGLDNGVAQVVDISTNISNANFNVTTTRSSAHSAHHDPDLHKRTTDIISEWRCLNRYLAHSNRASPWFNVRIQQSEFGWGTPMFERDLKQDWPEGLPIETP